MTSEDIVRNAWTHEALVTSSAAVESAPPVKFVGRWLAEGFECSDRTLRQIPHVSRHQRLRPVRRKMPNEFDWLSWAQRRRLCSFILRVIRFVGTLKREHGIYFDR